jgi:hypothetical protein
VASELFVDRARVVRADVVADDTVLDEVHAIDKLGLELGCGLPPCSAATR